MILGTAADYKPSKMTPLEAYELRKSELKMEIRRHQALERQCKHFPENQEYATKLEIMRRNILTYESLVAGYKKQYGFD